MKNYPPSKKCNKCGTKESNMYTFTWKENTKEVTINLCNDCVGRCFIFLLSQPGFNLEMLNALSKFIYENNKRTI